MINSIIKGITNAIYQEFGDDYEIYTEEVEQGLEEPCFFVYCINPQSDIFLDRRRVNSHQFAVQYIAKGPNKKAEINGVFSRLNTVVEFIYVNGDKMMASNVASNIEGGVLTITLSYKYFSYKKEEAYVMEEHVLNQEVNSND